MGRTGVLVASLFSVSLAGTAAAQDRGVTLVAGPSLADARGTLGRYLGNGYGAAGGVIVPLGVIGRVTDGARPVAFGAALGYVATGDLRLVREENLPQGVISGLYLPPTPTAGSWLSVKALATLAF